MSAASKKPHLNMIVVGHIDNGKSTTMGHLLMDLGLVDERTIAAHAAESEKTGKGDTFKYAWVMDNIKDERERGITIDLAFQKFETPKYFFTLIDAPGHRDLIKKSPNMPWWTGKTLYEAFDEFKLPDKPTNKPLRIPVQDVYTITGVGTVPVGRVETGVAKPGMKVVVMPSGAIGEIKSIETHHTQMESAEPGDNIGFNLRGIEKKDIKRGDVIGSPDNPPNVAKEIRAQIIVIHHPTAIAPGYTPVMHAHTAQVAATITAFEAKINPQSGAIEEKEPKFLKAGDSAIVRIRPVRPLPIETFQDFPELGRFALRDMGATIAAGVVKEITEKFTK